MAFGGFLSSFNIGWILVDYITQQIYLYVKYFCGFFDTQATPEAVKLVERKYYGPVPASLDVPPALRDDDRTRDGAENCGWAGLSLKTLLLWVGGWIL